MKVRKLEFMKIPWRDYQDLSAVVFIAGMMPNSSFKTTT